MFYQSLRKRHKLSISEVKDITVSSVDIKKIIKEYHEIYANKFEHLDKNR